MSVGIGLLFDNKGGVRVFKFWTDEMSVRKVLVYSFAPFFEEVAALLLATKHLWHPWSVKRRDELEQLAYALKEHADRSRQLGLAWAGRLTEFGGDSSYLLSMASHERWYDNAARKSCPEAASYTVGLAVQILFLLLPALKNIEKNFYEERGLVEEISKIIETLVEASYHDSQLAFSETTLKMASVYGILVECEGLAETQAIVEDSFFRENQHLQRKKEPRLSDDQIRTLASEIDVSFEVLKDVMSTETSSWWDEKEKYKNQACMQKTTLIHSLPVEPHIQEAIKNSWDVGMIDTGNPRCWSQQQMQDSENIIRTLISMFLFSVSSGEGTTDISLIGGPQIKPSMNR